MTHEKLRWGIMSTANIGRRSTIPGIQESDQNEVVAVASRSLENAEKFAKEMNIPNTYGSYEALLNDDEIDAIYIPLPNHLHKEWTIKAARAGKHILCEKPFALDELEAKEMVEASKENNVVLMEGFMYRYQDRYADIKERIKKDEIGIVRAIHAAFTFDSSEDKGNIRYTKEWGGGSVYDVGCYTISAARLILGDEPLAVTTQAYFSPEHGDVDMMASGLMEFPNDVALTFQCSMWSAPLNQIEILGTKGRILIHSAFLGDQSYEVIINGQSEIIRSENTNPYKRQADLFAETVQNRNVNPFPVDDPIKNMRAVKAALESAESKKRIILS